MIASSLNRSAAVVIVWDSDGFGGGGGGGRGREKTGGGRGRTGAMSSWISVLFSHAWGRRYSEGRRLASAMVVVAASSSASSFSNQQDPAKGEVMTYRSDFRYPWDFVGQLEC